MRNPSLTKPDDLFAPRWRCAACALAALLAATPSQADGPCLAWRAAHLLAGGRAATPARWLPPPTPPALAISPPSTLNSEAQLQGALTLAARNRVEGAGAPATAQRRGRARLHATNEAQLMAAAALAMDRGQKVSAGMSQGFRPNDLVQQETRRSLLNLPLEAAQHAAG